ncbi:MAG: TrkA family potassium uptake protein [Chloroflexi bacterium]|nr:TrkA family potassium uptake protein [Chloroflexota bacterium]
MKVLIIGCGRIGAELARSLRLAGHSVAVIDNDPQSLENLGSAFKGHTFLGVGFEREVLLKAGIERVDALAAVTPNDEMNLTIGRLARQTFQVPRVAVRVYDPRKAEIYRRYGLLTISAVTIGANRLMELLTVPRLDVVTSLGLGEVNLIDVEVRPLLAGKKVSSLAIAGEVHVVAISRGGRTFLPTPETTFEEGDRIYLAVLAASSDRLKALLD